MDMADQKTLGHLVKPVLVGGTDQKTLGLLVKPVISRRYRSDWF